MAELLSQQPLHRCAHMHAIQEPRTCTSFPPGMDRVVHAIHATTSFADEARSIWRLDLRVSWEGLRAGRVWAGLSASYSAQTMGRLPGRTTLYGCPGRHPRHQHPPQAEPLRWECLLPRGTSPATRQDHSAVVWEDGSGGAHMIVYGGQLNVRAARDVCRRAVSCRVSWGQVIKLF